MAYELVVYQSQTNENYCDNTFADPDRTQKRAETYVDGAITNTTSSGTSVLSPSATPDCPQQDINGSFSATKPCGSSTETYDDLLQWFDDWLDCNNYTRAADITLLLTGDLSDTPNGGLTYFNQGGELDSLCGAQGGAHIAHLPPTYEKYGFDDDSDPEPYEAMHTALEEVGHILIDPPSNDEVDGDKDNNITHDYGVLRRRGSNNNFTISPMTIDNLESDSVMGNRNNNCVECGYPFKASLDGYDLVWADCADQYFINGSA